MNGKLVSSFIITKSKRNPNSTNNSITNYIRQNTLEFTGLKIDFS